MNKESIHESESMKKEYVYSNTMYIFIIFYNFLSIFYMYCSEIIPPNIEVIAPVIQSTIIELSSIKDTTEESTTACTQAIFEAALTKKLFPTIIEYSAAKKDFFLYISFALDLFKDTILAHENIYFKECPQLKEILFPQHATSPLKMLNPNNTPRSSSPVHNRRSSGSLAASPLFNKFSVDPDMQEMPKDIALKTPAHKSRALFIIAHCMVTMQPDILHMLYDNLKTEAYKTIKEHTNTLEKNKKSNTETKQTDAISYTLLQEQYNSLQNIQNDLQNHQIPAYITTITDLKNELQQQNDATIKERNKYKKEIATLESTIQNLETTITTNNATIDTYKKAEATNMKSLTTSDKQIKAYEKTVNLYKLGTGMCVACNIFLLIILLYQNKLLPQFIHA